MGDGGYGEGGGGGGDGSGDGEVEMVVVVMVVVMGRTGYVPGRTPAQYVEFFKKYAPKTAEGK